MKINVRHLNIRSNDKLDSWIENRVLNLGKARQIDEAEVTLQYGCEFSPPFRVHVHLVTPGTDLFAETADHTVRAAFDKAMTELQTKITERAGKRLQRIRSDLSAPAAKSRPAKAFYSGKS